MDNVTIIKRGDRGHPDLLGHIRCGSCGCEWVAVLPKELSMDTCIECPHCSSRVRWVPHHAPLGKGGMLESQRMSEYETDVEGARARFIEECRGKAAD